MLKKTSRQGARQGEKAEAGRYGMDRTRSGYSKDRLTGDGSGRNIDKDGARTGW